MAVAPREIGKVISTEDSPSTSKFTFLVTAKETRIGKGMWVQVRLSDDERIIARVDEVVRTNEAMASFEAVSESEERIFPVESYEYLLGIATPLGVWKDGMQSRVLTPPSPGSSVEVVDNKTLAEFLGFDENGMEIGTVELHELPAKLSVTRTFQRHCAILAQTGFGKSYLVSVILEEILRMGKERLMPGLVVIDHHGEYVGFSQDKEFGERVAVYGKGDIKIGVSNLTAEQIAEFQPHITSVGKRELSKVLEELKKNIPSFTFKEVLSAIEVSDIPAKTKPPLISWIQDLDSTGLFDKFDSPSENELVRMGCLSVIDLSGYVSLKNKRIIVTHLARKLFNARKEGRIPPFILFIEEAHNFAPQQVEKSEAISKSVIETIAREGRKFGACLTLITQRPVKLSTTALSQCDTHVVLHVSNPYDQEHIGRSCEGISRELLNLLPGLKVGEAIVAGGAVNYPVIVKVRKRKTELLPVSKSLEELCEEFRRKVEDLEAFK